LFDDLRKLGVTPEEGMKLRFYDLDADDLERPTLCAGSVLRRDKTKWHAAIDQNSFHSVLRSDVDHEIEAE